MECGDPIGYTLRMNPAKTALRVILAILVSGMWVCFPQTAQGPGLNSTALLQYLDQTIAWYRLLDLQRQMVTDTEEGWPE